MSGYTYDELATAVQEYLETDEPTFVAAIPQFVRSAEERILQSVQLKVFYRQQAIANSAGVGSLTPPADVLALTSVRYQIANVARLLEQKDATLLDEFWPEPAKVGEPRFYAFERQDLLRIAPTPEEAGDVVLRYFHRPESLVDAPPGDKTWLSTNAPDAMLYGTLVEAAIFQKAEPQDMQTYDGRFTYALQRLKNLGEAEQTIDHLRFGQQRTPRT